MILNNTLDGRQFISDLDLLGKIMHGAHGCSFWNNNLSFIHKRDNDNDNILFDDNIQIEIIMYNSLENQIINWSGDYY